MYEEQSTSQVVEAAKKVVNRTPQKYLDNKIALSKSFQEKYPTEYNEALKASDIAKHLHRLYPEESATAMSEMPATCKLCGSLPQTDVEGKVNCANSTCVLNQDVTKYTDMVAWNKSMEG